MSAFTLPSASLLAQSILSGIFVGALYGLLGLGLSLSWGLLRLINLAHFAFAFLAAYLCYQLATMGVDPLLTLLVIVPAFFALGAGAALADGALRGHAVQLAAADLRPDRHRRGGDPVDLDGRLPQARVGLRARRSSRSATLFVPVPELITLVLAVGALARASGRCCATPTSARRCAPRPRTRRSPRPSASTSGATRSLLAGTCSALAAIAGVCLALSFTLAPSQIYAWIGVVFAAVMLGGLGQRARAAARRHR